MEIILKNVKKSYGKDSCALNGIDLYIKAGSLMAIMGTSGAGKSTLLHILGCIDRMSEGEYILDGKNIEKYSDKELSAIRNEKIGFVLQEFGLIEHRTVFDNISVPILLGKKHFTKKEIEKKVMTVLKKVGLAELRNRKAYQLSGGQKQRVAIARAIVNNPALILADEPTGSLDSRNAKNIMELLLEIHSPQTSVLVVTHDRNIASYCSELIELSDGKIVN